LPGGGTFLGIAYFAAVKFAGYSAAGYFVNRSENTNRPKPLVFGGVRTALGIAAGISYSFLLSWVSVSNQELIFYAGLIPVRFLEWLLVLWLFYRNVPQVRARRMLYVVLGVIWSYILDLPAVLIAFVLPGGFWIC
jgi:hypothetical protein